MTASYSGVNVGNGGGMNGASKQRSSSAHVIRVTVLGLAGITVDRTRCKDKNPLNPHAPPAPSDMKAIVAFSRNNTIRGTTSLSKPLAKSPNEDIMVDDGTLAGKEASLISGSTPDRPQRHVAVWANDTTPKATGGFGEAQETPPARSAFRNNKNPAINSLGSIVTFETNLHSMGDKYAPKSFDLTIALAEAHDLDLNTPHRVALPFGVATLAVGGNECLRGNSVELDLPVLSLGAARPLGSSSRNGFPLIAIQTNRNSPNNNNKRQEQLQNSTNPIKKLFQGRHSHTPPAAARNAFGAAYSMDAAGDAILRVSLEVYKKGSPLEKHFLKRHADETASIFTGPSMGLPPKSPKSNVPPKRLVPQDKESSRPSMTHTNDDDDDDDDDDEQGEDGSAYGEDENENVAYFTWTKEMSSENDGYTLSFEKDKEDTDKSTVEKEHHGEHIKLDLFGYPLQVPTCGSILHHLNPHNAFAPDDETIVTRQTLETNEHTAVTEGTRCQQLPREPAPVANASLLDRDQMTHVTADFFGKTYRIPICAVIAPGQEDDTVTTYTNAKDPKIAQWTDMVCKGSRADVDHDAIDFTRTFSTLSLLSKERVISEQRPTSVKDFLKQSNNPKSVDLNNDPFMKNADEGDVTQTSSTKKTSLSNSSPKGVTDLPSLGLEQSLPSRSVKGPEYGMTNLLHTPTKSKPGSAHRVGSQQLDVVLHDAEACGAKVPPIIIPTGEDNSIGDLTANTHEMLLAHEAKVLARHRQQFHLENKRERKPKPISVTITDVMPVPVAFGGNGLCPGTLHSPARVSSRERIILTSKSTRPVAENYFAEYDDFSNVAPFSGIMDAESPPRIPKFSNKDNSNKNLLIPEGNGCPEMATMGYVANGTQRRKSAKVKKIRRSSGGRSMSVQV